MKYFNNCNDQNNELSFNLCSYLNVCIDEYLAIYIAVIVTLMVYFLYKVMLLLSHLI